MNQLEKEMDGIIMIMMQALICPGKHEELNITVNTIQHILWDENFEILYIVKLKYDIYNILYNM